MFTRRIMIGAIGGLVSVPLAAQNNELHMIVGSGTGGSSDISTRLLANYLNQNGVSSAVSNRPAGNGVEAALHVMRLPSDSKTVLSNGLGAIHLAPARERLDYNSDSLAPVCMFSTAAFVLAVRNGTFDSIGSLIERGKSSGISIAQGGAETQYFVDVFANVSGTKVVNITYRSGGDAMRDLIAGTVDAAYISIAAAAGFARSGELKFLAHTLDGIDRIPGFNEVPHIFSIGSRHPGLLSYGYHALYASKAMPNNVLLSIASSVHRICEMEKFKDDHLTRGMMVIFKGPNELKQHHESITKNLVQPYIEWIKRRA
jgi:tripartite-type tricarboxylate transporter receptor subunit TctC